MGACGVHYGGVDNHREGGEVPINRAEVKCPGKLATTQAGAQCSLNGHSDVSGRKRKSQGQDSRPLFPILTTCPKTWVCSSLSRMRETEYGLYIG